MIVKKDFDLILPYTLDSANMKGNAEVVYIPENESELVEILKECYKNSEPVTISAAGTGLTGGKTPLGGAIISTEKLDKLIALDIDKKTITIQPGVIFSEMDKTLSENNLFYPPNPTETNSTLGGNVATNASGARTFKYGATREFVTRLKIVLMNGDIINLKRGEVFEKNGFLELVSLNGNLYKIPVSDIKMPEIKHAAGYYLKPGMDAIDLFIGSEGTLGVYSEIELNLLDRPLNILGGLVFFDDKDNMVEFINQLREISIKNNSIHPDDNQDMSARLIEFFDFNSLNVLRPQFPEIPEKAIGAVWFEQEYSLEFEEILMEKWYEFINEHTQYSDVTWFATEEKMHEKLRDFRHQLPLNVYEKLTDNAYKKVGTDTAVPNESFDDLFNFLSDSLAESGLSNVMFGHVGNNHLHANLFVNNEEEYEDAMAIYDKVINFSLERGGTVSAEHGIGKIKKKYLLRMFGQDNINKMKEIKQILDDKYLLNQGNLFD